MLLRLHAEITRATNHPEFRKRYLDRGIEILASQSPEAFSAYIRSEADGFAKLVRDAGIAVE